MMGDRSLDDLFPPPRVPGLGYICSSCGEPAPCDSEHLVDSPDREDTTIPPDETLMRLLCDKCLGIDKLRREPTDDERKKHEAALRIVDDMQAEAAWERYRDSSAMRLVLQHPEPGDLRLAFEAGFRAALEEKARQ
jgi:hypothetical protein